MSNKARTTAITIAATIGVGLGSFGIAAAQTSPGSGPAPTSADAPEVSENETVDDAIDPARAAEARVTEAEAVDAAIAAVGSGTASDAILGDENGALVYEVDVTDGAGTNVEVAVDATTGEATIDADEADEVEDEHESDAADEADDSDQDGIDHQNEHEGDNDPDAEHAD